MSRPLRYIPHQSLVEVTAKTFQDRFLLKPSAELNRRIVGVFARAKARYGVQVHALTVLSNHYHCLLSPGDGERLARFMNFVQSNIATEAGRLHGWSGRFWKDRYRSIPVSDEEAAQVARLRYLLSNGCKEGLVDRPSDWPGVHSAQALAEGTALEGVWYDRTALSKAGRNGKCPKEKDFSVREVLQLDPLPCWRQHPGDDVRRWVAEVVLDIETEFGAARRPRRSRARLGAIHPHRRPAATARTPAPWVHAASRTKRARWGEAQRQFVAAFRAAKQRQLAGDPSPPFPPGSFPPGLPFVPFPPGSPTGLQEDDQDVGSKVA